VSEQVIQAYPTKHDPRDSSWVWVCAVPNAKVADDDTALGYKRAHRRTNLPPCFKYIVANVNLKILVRFPDIFHAKAVSSHPPFGAAVVGSDIDEIKVDCKCEAKVKVIIEVEIRMGFLRSRATKFL